MATQRRSPPGDGAEPRPGGSASKLAGPGKKQRTAPKAERPITAEAAAARVPKARTAQPAATVDSNLDDVIDVDAAAESDSEGEGDDEPGEDLHGGAGAPVGDDEALDAEVVDMGGAEPSESELGDDAGAGNFELPAAGGALTRYDALQAYMRDVHRYHVLDAETQRELAVRYREQGDVDAARQLVTSNLRLVVKIAYDYRRAYRNVMDLIQEGNIGLMQAVKKFDPYKGVKLSSYAAWWIRAYILRFILNNWRLVKIGTTQAQRKLFFNLSKEKARLEAMGIDPSPENIAERLDVTVDDVTSMDRRLSAGEMSLDTPVGGDESKSQTRVDLMPALGRRVDELLADEELGRMLHDELHGFGQTLKGKEARIFYERLMAEDPRTLQELGTDFGVSRERVRQLEKRLQEKLKKYIEERLGSEVFAP
jgi:RNA polymerase sigma-32 factor